VSAVKRLGDAEKILSELRASKKDSFDSNLTEFVKSIYEACNALLDEYNRKFDCGAGHSSLEKFKSRAKKLGRVDAISFLVWYEKEFRAIRDDPSAGILLEKREASGMSREQAIEACSILLERTRSLVYGAYERF